MRSFAKRCTNRANMTRRLCWIAVFGVFTVALPPAVAQDDALLPPPLNLKVLSRQLRVDLVWNSAVSATFEIQRAANADGPFETLKTDFPDRTIQSDFLGQSGVTFYYRVRTVQPGASDKNVPAATSTWSAVLKGTSTSPDPEMLLTEVQEAGFRYFYDYGHPVSGLARESFRRNPDVCTTGATGMGMFNLIVGIERGFIDRAQGTDRALQILTFLSEKSTRYHGAFSHWINGTTGKTIPFSQYDDGADLVETAFLMQGILLLREYFSQDNPREVKIRGLADTLWREVEWDWFVRDEETTSHLLWHWSPNFEWKKNLKITGFNEAQCAYLLAMASPTHPIRRKCYTCGWETSHLSTQRTEFGIPMELGVGVGPSLFFTHYSYLGFDPKQILYGKKCYFEHFQNFCKVQIRYAESMSATFTGYGPLWGITSSYGPDGYRAFAPGANDNGTLAPTAALSSMPYVPDESRHCLREMYEKHGKQLWSPFGFYDAFNLKRNWVSNDVLGIDVGPIAPMIENYRTGLCWKIFMHAHEIQPVIKFLAIPPKE